MDTEQAGRERESGAGAKAQTPGDILPDASVKFADIGQLWKAYRSLRRSLLENVSGCPSSNGRGGYPETRWRRNPRAPRFVRAAPMAGEKNNPRPGIFFACAETAARKRGRRFPLFLRERESFPIRKGVEEKIPIPNAGRAGAATRRGILSRTRPAGNGSSGST